MHLVVQLCQTGIWRIKIKKKLVFFAQRVLEEADWLANRLEF